MSCRSAVAATSRVKLYDIVIASSGHDCYCFAFITNYCFIWTVQQTGQQIGLRSWHHSTLQYRPAGNAPHYITAQQAAQQTAQYSTAQQAVQQIAQYSSQLKPQALPSSKQQATVQHSKQHCAVQHGRHSSTIHQCMHDCSSSTHLPRLKHRGNNTSIRCSTAVATAAFIAIPTELLNRPKGAATPESKLPCSRGMQSSSSTDAPPTPRRVLWLLLSRNRRAGMALLACLISLKRAAFWL